LLHSCPGGVEREQIVQDLPAAKIQLFSESQNDNRDFFSQAQEQAKKAKNRALKFDNKANDFFCIFAR